VSIRNEQLAEAVNADPALADRYISDPMTHMSINLLDRFLSLLDAEQQAAGVPAGQAGRVAQCVIDSAVTPMVMDVHRPAEFSCGDGTFRHRVPRELLSDHP